jgi:diacylglycerol kinase family enzyme
VRAVVNLASGGVGPAAAGELAALLDTFGLEHEVSTPEPERVAQAVADAVGARPDLLIILAGDGTARLAAELCGPDGPLVAPLPGGTLNMLPRALYGERSWRDALILALAEGIERAVSGGEIGGRHFYCVAILGSPALWARAREAARAGKLSRAWRQAVEAFHNAFLTHLRFRLDGGERRKATALSLICPLVSLAFNDECALEAAVLDPHDAAEVFRLGLNNLLGDWRRDPSVSVQPCMRGQVWAKAAVPCLLDGEIRLLARFSEFTFQPRAFRALAPAPVSAQAVRLAP